IGVERRQPVSIQRVDAASLVDKLPDVPVDLRTVTLAVEHAAGDDRLGLDRLRVIALVGDGHQAVFESEGTDDLGGAGQERGDAHPQAPGTNGLSSFSSSILVAGSLPGCTTVFGGSA